MMGRQSVPQEPLFYGFNLERHVPAGHLLRLIDRFVDLQGVRGAPPALLQRHRAAFHRPGAPAAPCSLRRLSPRA